jgi:hypothetical protein
MGLIYPYNKEFLIFFVVNVEASTLSRLTPIMMRIKSMPLNFIFLLLMIHLELTIDLSFKKIGNKSKLVGIFGY